MRTKRKYRLLFAAVDIGWRISTYQNFLEEKFGDEIKIESLVKYKVPDEHYKAQYTYQIKITKYPSAIQWLISGYYFVIALFKYSHFYFFSGETLLTRRLRPFELRLYKLFGKKVIFHFVGSDIRDPGYLNWKANHITTYLQGDQESEKSQLWQKALLADSERYADQIFVSTPDLLKICPSATYFPLIVDVNHMKAELSDAKLKKETFFKTDQLRILHAPSNPMTKGSTLVCKVMEELKQEGLAFEFIYTPDLQLQGSTAYSVSRYQLFRLYQEADIVIDQMVIGWYGMQSIEGLLADCKVVCYIDKKLGRYLSTDSPIIQADAIDLGKRMRDLIKEGKSGNDHESIINWIKKEHSLETQGQLLTKLFGN